jgi:hypothetical protein
VAEPQTTGEAIQIIRRILYDLARIPGWSLPGASQAEILNYAITHKWPVPSREFEKAIEQLERHGVVTVTHELGVSGGRTTHDRYALTAQGDLDEEHKRRPFLLRLADELRRPQTSVDMLKLFVGFALGLLSGLFLGQK